MPPSVEERITQQIERAGFDSVGEITIVDEAPGAVIYAAFARHDLFATDVFVRARFDGSTVELLDDPY